MPRAMKAPPSPIRDDAEHAAGLHEFTVTLRQNVMEFDAADLDRNCKLDFKEFSKMVRAREIAIHTEAALRERFELMDTDASGTIEVSEFIKYALRDALARSATTVRELLKEWDIDKNGKVDKHEFRRAVRHFGFQARDAEIDAVFAEFDVLGDGKLDLKTLVRQLSETSSMPAGHRLNRLRKLCTTLRRFDATNPPTSPSPSPSPRQAPRPRRLDGEQGVAWQGERRNGGRAGGGQERHDGAARRQDPIDDPRLPRQAHESREFASSECGSHPRPRPHPHPSPSPSSR